MDTLVRDARYALRLLAKTPGFTAVAVLTMAVAIGSCVSLYSVLQAVVMRPLPYASPDRLVVIQSVNRETHAQTSAVSWAKYELFREQTDLFSGVSATADDGFTLTDGAGNPEKIGGLHVTANFLPLLGVQLARGRNFTAAEDEAGAAPVAIISHRLWQSRFGGESSVLGRTLHLNGAICTIVGILPKNFSVPYEWVDILVSRPRELPYLPKPAPPFIPAYSLVARLAPGVSLAQADLRLRDLAAGFREKNPAVPESANDNSVVTLRQTVIGDTDRTLLVLAACVAAVLLVACANVANLFLARLSSRRKEIAVRLSLGAPRAAIVRQFVIEGALFTLASGVAGVLIAAASTHTIQSLAGSSLPRADQITLDRPVLAIALGLSVLAGLLISIYPAVQASRTDVQDALKDTTRGSGGGRAAKAFRQLLVGCQVAISFPLLVGAGLLLLSFHRLQQVDLGFRPAGVAIGSVGLPASRYSTPEQTRNFYRRLDERLNETPELAHGAAVVGPPLFGYTRGLNLPYGIQGQSLPPAGQRPVAGMRMVTPGYFATMGIPLKSGRLFDSRDRQRTDPVAIVNEGFARRLFENGSAVDRALVIGPGGDYVVRIVGVVGDVRSAGISEPCPDEIYLARGQMPELNASMQIVGVARPGFDAVGVIPVLRQVLHDLDPEVALAGPQTMDAVVSNALGLRRLAMALLIAFGGIATLLAAVGLYSVMAYTVVQQTGEFGVRVALGASPAGIVRLVLRHGAVQVGAGLAVGVGIAFAFSRIIQSQLYSVSPHDPEVFASVLMLFVSAAALACMIPAFRASRVDPMVALRSE